jgi:hypothetical protein
MKRRFLLFLLTFTGFAGAAHAQYPPNYVNGSYPPAPMYAPYGYGGFPGYYGYPQAAPQPIQPVQYSYGNNGNAPNYPPPNGGYYAPNNYGYSNGYGVNYYYMRNPIGPSSTPAPYSATANQRALENVPASYPVPAGTQVVVPGGDPFVVPEETLPGTDPPQVPIVFHRKPAEWGWIEGEYLSSFIRPMRLSSPLVTEGSLNDAHPGALGQPGTTVLYGGSPIDFGMFSGFSMQGGVFLDGCNRFSLDAIGFWLPENTQTFSTSSDPAGNPLIARPFFRTDAGPGLPREGDLLVSLPGNLTGTVSVLSRSQLGGVEFNFRYHAYLLERLHADGLVGFRYMRLAEQLGVSELINQLPGSNALTYLGPTVPPPDALAVQDSFSTSNQFFGPQIGGRLTYEQTWYSVEGFAKVAFGATQQLVNIDGSTTLLTPTGNSTATGGVLALSSNIGAHNQTVFGILPEFGITVGVNLTQHIQLKLGYSFLMLNQVVRPGLQIDHNVNPSLIPGSFSYGNFTGATAPTFHFNEEFFYMSNLHIGIEFHF